MKLLSFSVIIFSVSALLYQINCFTNKGAMLFESGISYIVDGVQNSWKYSLSFIENSHEHKLNKIRKEKEKIDLQRQIRIEEIEDELEEVKSIVHKSMPNYNNLLMLFGPELPYQYEFACQIEMMKGTVFVSESLGTLATIVKEETGKKLEDAHMKYIVDKIIEKEVYMNVLIKIYEQQFKYRYISNNKDADKENSLLILNNAVKNYESAWNMYVANEFLKNAQKLYSNLTFIDYVFVSQSAYDAIIEQTEPAVNDNREGEEKNGKYKTITKERNNVNHDPKCKDKPYHVQEDSIWNKYSKYT